MADQYQVLCTPIQLGGRRVWRLPTVQRQPAGGHLAVHRAAADESYCWRLLGGAFISTTLEDMQWRYALQNYNCLTLSALKRRNGEIF